MESKVKELCNLISNLSKTVDTLKGEVERNTYSLETADDIREVQKMLEKVVMPWQVDGCTPPNFIRVTGMGKRVGIADCWLGGYAKPHQPELHGWGYNAQHGTRVHEGIVESKEEAMYQVDTFLEEQGFRLLSEAEE